MKPTIARKWIKALESGSYRQLDGKLKSKKGDKKYGYCCLGVLCDLYKKETGEGKWEDNGGDKTFVCVEGEPGDYDSRDASESELPQAVRKWAGMDSDSGALKEPITYLKDGNTHTANSLIHLNDDAKYNFKKIAKVIKANVATL